MQIWVGPITFLPYNYWFKFFTEKIYILNIGQIFKKNTKNVEVEYKKNHLTSFFFLSTLDLMFKSQTLN